MSTTNASADETTVSDEKKTEDHEAISLALSRQDKGDSSPHTEISKSSPFPPYHLAGVHLRN